MKREKQGGQAVRNSRKGERLWLFLVLLTACPPLVSAQQSQPAPALYRTGKWIAVAAAAGFTALGIADHNAANTAYNGLVTYCAGGTCQLGPDGHYTDPAAEARYREVVTNDRAARAWLLGGQLALVGAVGLFILELHHSSKEPPNIPFSGLTIAPARVAGASAVKIGWRLAVP